MSSVSHDRRWVRSVFHVALAIFCALAFHRAGYAQSTFGAVLGSVKDPSGSLIPGAKVDLLNTGTNAVHSTLTKSDGVYEFVNVEVGNYTLKVEAAGFQITEYRPFDIAARETKRIDVQMNVAAQATVVEVQALDAVLQTDASNVAETKGSLELTNLPVSIGTRASGSTSAYSTLGAQPGVQFDSANNIQVAGALPSQLSFTIDGISSVGPGSLGALTELFPSFNAIEEIKLSETLNPAEFGGVADITTISKSGTNEFHGGAFENVQNTDFNAADFFSNQVTPVKLNNFGLYLGGPIIIPKIYNGRNRTFFFGSFEVLRLPKSYTTLLSVPTAAMRSGDLSAYLDPSNGGSSNALTGYPGNIIPQTQLNSFAQSLSNLIYPLPNYGPPGAIANNYLATYAIPINSAQGDVRLDQSITPKHLLYARFTYKNRRINNYQEDGSGNPSTPLLGDVSTPQIYDALAASYNWIVSPSMVNELRGGYSLVHRNVTFGITAQQAATTLGLTNLPGIPPGDDIPSLSITGFMGISSQANDTNPHEGTYQLTDTFTWTKQKHTLKFGGDYRYLSSLFTEVFNNYRMGNYQFNGAVMSQLLGPGAAVPIASYLLGYPDLTAIATVINPTTNAYAQHYALFAQDDWKVSPKLTINYGLRWEYHPGFHDKNNNVVNFDPYYSSTIDGQTVAGAIILPNQAAFANINPAFTESLAPTPLLLASQVGVPSNLRFSSKRDFAPRVGFAYRIGGNNKTVIRGGYGRFIEALMSGTAINGWSVGSSDVGFFSNSINTNGTPQYTMPYSFPSNIAQPGTQFFDLASEIKYKDPIVEEWNLTLERELGKGVGVRLSYSGNHSYNIPTVVNADQVRANTLGFSDPATQASIPFPLLSYIAEGTSLKGYGNYNSGTASVHKRSANLEFEASYTYSRDLTNVNGAPIASASAFVSEFGNTLSDPYNPGVDYGNTPYDRRQRFLVTFLYELPFGKGKTFFTGANGVVDRIIGGWELSGVYLLQTGPFMSVALLSDPSGTGYNIFNLNGGRADTVPGVNPYAGQSINQWINPNAFADPCATLCQTLPNGVTTAIGRWGDSQSGAVVGPGTNVASLSLIKHIPLAERVRMEVGLQVANIANHPNFAPPGTLTLGVAGFGQVTSLQSAEGAGPRALQLTGRITF
jgi:hypothetical protein